jgi:hypothetical protein
VDNLESFIEIGDFQGGLGSSNRTMRQQISPLTWTQFVKSTVFGLSLALLGNILCLTKGSTAFTRRSQYAFKYVYAIRYADDLINQKKMQHSAGFELAEPLWKTLACHFSDENINDRRPSDFKNALQVAGETTGSISDIIKARKVFTTGVTISRKTFLVGKDASYGLTEARVRKGDLLALIFLDNFIPFILRPKGNAFTMIGPAYIPDAMRDAAIVSKAETLREISIL